MKLPNIDHGQIQKEKIVDYLLSFEHRDGRSKASFFTRFGFSSDHWKLMARALTEHARKHDIQSVDASPFGNRYVVEGPIQCPDGREPHIRAIWFIRADEEHPRFVTAYPLPRGQER